MEDATTFVATTPSKEELYKEWFKPPYSWFKFEDDDQVLVRYEKVFEHPGCSKRTEVMDITTFKLCYRKWILEEDFDPNEPEEKEEKGPHKVHENPVITCSYSDDRIIPESVSIDFDNPLNKRLERDEVSGTVQTIVWLIKHMMSATVIVNIDDPKQQITYKDCELRNLLLSPDGISCLEIGNYSERIDKLDF